MWGKRCVDEGKGCIEPKGRKRRCLRGEGVEELGEAVLQ